jgi:hypothetical protein
MVQEQIAATLAIVKKTEMSLTAEIVAFESKEKSKRRRSVGHEPEAGYRSRSQMIE